jgi:CRP-like cAMP-binding protein
MRRELTISDDEHQQVLEELGVEDPDLLNPERQRSLENQIRLSGYQRSLERLLRLQTQPGLTSQDPSPENAATLRALRSEYAITPQEEAWVLTGLEGEGLQKAEGLLARLRQWVACNLALNHPTLEPHAAVVAVLEDAVTQKEDLIVRSLLEILPTLPEHPTTAALAQELYQLSPPPLAVYLSQASWRSRLPLPLVKTLTAPPRESPGPAASPSREDTVDHLDHLLTHYNPLVAASALYLLAHLDSERAALKTQTLLQGDCSALLRDTAERLGSRPGAPPLKDFPALEKLVYLFNSDFFHRLNPSTLMALADQAEVRTYRPGEAITEAGDTCRELLILIEGDAAIHYQGLDSPRVEHLLPGLTLDELAVLTHSTLENTILAGSENTRILAVPVDAFDTLLDQDPDFARRVLELESKRIQQIMNPLKTT